MEDSSAAGSSRALDVQSSTKELTAFQEFVAPGDDPETIKFPWYNPATTSGLVLCYLIMTLGAAVSYYWSIGQCIVLGGMVIGVGYQICAFIRTPIEHPLPIFFLFKAVSVIIGSIFLLLVRWRVGPFGDADDPTSISNGGIHYNSGGYDPPGNYNTAGYVVIIILLSGNIVEAMISEYFEHRGAYNPLLGLGLVVSLPTQPQWRHFTISWVTAYTIWNIIFVMRRFGIRAGFLQAGHNIIPYVATVLWNIPNGWIYLRCHTLGIFLAFVDHILTSWLHKQPQQWRDRWLHNSAANDKEVLSNSVTTVLLIIAWVCVVLCWIPGANLA